ncbi:MAG TPA: hypothetical protein VGK67_19810, partial [Myxococcales bacterium]
DRRGATDRGTEAALYPPLVLEQGDEIIAVWQVSADGGKSRGVRGEATPATWPEFMPCGK